MLGGGGAPLKEGNQNVIKKKKDLHSPINELNKILINATKIKLKLPFF